MTDKHRKIHPGGMTGKVLEKPELTLGFVPLTDCAPLVIAKEKGYFEKYGLSVTLSRESSWANIRDKVCVGLLDGAQMLAGIPLAIGQGTNPTCVPMITALSLDLNGNGITVSQALFGAMAATGIEGLNTAIGSAQALAAVIAQRQQAGQPPLTFAVVFPVSSHNYLLRYWMAAGGIDADRDVKLIVVPPPQMVNYLRAGVIAGFCVGEPWNAHAVNAGIGHTLITSYDIWNNHPEKVFGVTRAWAEANPNTHQATLMALLEAAAWLDEPAHRLEACGILSAGRYINAPVEVLAMSLTGTFQFSADTPPVARPDFNVFHRYGANFPWRSHALWLLTQMVRWGQLEASEDLPKRAAMVYRPELYRKAAEALGLPYPTIDSKPEGLHADTWSLAEATTLMVMGKDRFMDGIPFDPASPLAYLGQLRFKGTRPHVQALGLT